MPEEKSTVAKVCENSTWGKIMYDACYMFNKNLSDWWLEYCINYDDGVITGNLEGDMQKAIAQRDDIFESRKQHAINISQQGKRAVFLYKQYNNMHSDSKAIRGYRAYMQAIKSNKDAKSWESDAVAHDNYLTARKSLYEQYSDALKAKKRAEQQRDNFNAEHYYESKKITNRITAIKRKMEYCSHSLCHSICYDYDLLNNFLLSQEMTERLMGMCLTILASNTGNAFILQLSESQKEEVCEKLYDYFCEFKHNAYDFVYACYEIGSDGVLKMKSLEQLAKKLYNGYYCTLKGYCLRAFTSVANCNNVISISELFPNENDDECSNKGVDRIANTDNWLALGGTYESLVDDGLVDCWKEFACQAKKNSMDISKSIKQQMDNCFEERFYDDNEYCSMLQEMLCNLMDAITSELSEGRIIFPRIKNIVVDAMGGFESRKELECCVRITLLEIKKQMKKHFAPQESDFA